MEPSSRAELESLRHENVRLCARVTELERAELDAIERYRALALASALVIWGTTPDGEFFEREKGWQEFTGQSPHEARGFGWLSQVHPDDVVPLHAVWANASQTEQKFEVEYRLHHASGTFRRVLARGVPVRRGGQVVEWIGTIADVEDARRSEEAIREGEERLRFSLAASETGVWDWNVETGELAWNEGHHLFGREKGQPRLLDEYLQCIHADDVQGMLEQVTAALERDDMALMEYRLVHPDGKAVWVRALGRVMERGMDGRARRMMGVVSDVSAQKEAEQVLLRSREALRLEAQSAREESAELRRRLLARLVQAQEDERRRLSRELHDQMGQNLTVVAMGLKSLAGFVRETVEPLQVQHPWLESEIDRRFVALQAAIAGLGEQTDSLAHALRPPALDTLGLSAALRQLVRDWSEGCGIEAQFQVLGLEPGRADERETRFSPLTEVALYRVVQEALTNVARHSGARSASVLLQMHEGAIVVVVEDDGRGFDPLATPPARLGIVGMRERLEAIGGSLQIESEPDGGGTTMFARAPANSDCESG